MTLSTLVVTEAAAIVSLAAVYAVLERTSPGFLPTLCPSPESIAECASGPFALILVLVAAFALAAVHFRREAAVAVAAAAQQSRRKNELAMELMATRNKFMHTAESVSVGRAFAPRPSDVFVVTYPKCGTTWATQILHALRSGGHMAFGEITEVVPWDILAHDCGQSLEAEHAWQPRVYKSHEGASTVPAGARYVYVARNPLDAFLSFHKFLPAYTGLRPADITAEQFAEAIFAGASHSGQIWAHMLGWWARRHEPEVLWVFFEDLLEDLPAQVARVAAWAGLPGDAASVRRVCDVSSFAFMAAEENKHHFDDHFVRKHVLPKMGMPADQPTAVAKVRAGKQGSRAGLPPAVRALLEERWRTEFAPHTGCADYEALRTAIHALPPHPPPKPPAAASGAAARAARSPARARR